MSEWALLLKRLGEQQNVVAKVSGLPSALGTDSWTTADLRDPFDVALDAFGPARLMYGSDWPLVRLGGGPSRWHDAFDELVQPLTDEEQRLMRGGCATRTYRLEESQ
jgi:L-fuconolactonase